LTSYKAEIVEGEQPTIAFIDATNIEEPWGDSLSIRPGNSGYQLHGTSLPVRLASSAEYLVIAATDTEGEQVLLWLDKGSRWEVEEGDYRLGLLASGIARLTVNQIDVAKRHILAKGEKATELITQIQTRLQILHAAKEVGLMEAALHYATEYTAERKAFDQEI